MCKVLHYLVNEGWRGGGGPGQTTKSSDEIKIIPKYKDRTDYANFYCGEVGIKLEYCIVKHLSTSIYLFYSANVGLIHRKKYSITRASNLPSLDPKFGPDLSILRM